jgi:Zn-dependent protease with chaperone function
MKYIPRLPGKNVNVTPTSPLRDFMMMLGGLALLFVGSYVFLGLAVDFMVPRISPEMEQMLGDYLQTKWANSEKYPEQEEQLQGLLDRIQGQCGDLPYQLDVEVAESEMINALALPGGRVIILTGLLENVTSENELTFVLGHEMGHFANRDHLSELGRGLVFMALSAGVFGPNSYIGKQVGKLLQVSELSFSRQHESMADEYALDIQNCVYGHVAGATDFFELTGRLEKKQFTGHYLSTHPESSQRIASLKDLAMERGYVRSGEKIPFTVVLPVKEGVVPDE